MLLLLSSSSSSLSLRRRNNNNNNFLSLITIISSCCWSIILCNYCIVAIEDCTLDETGRLLQFYNEIASQLTACSEDINVPIPDISTLEVPEFTPYEQILLCGSDVCNDFFNLDFTMFPECLFAGQNVKEIALNIYDTIVGPCLPSNIPSMTPTILSSSPTISSINTDTTTGALNTGNGSGGVAATMGTITTTTTIVTSILFSIFFYFEFIVL